MHAFRLFVCTAAVDGVPQVCGLVTLIQRLVSRVGPAARSGDWELLSKHRECSQRLWCLFLREGINVDFVSPNEGRGG